MPVLRENRNRKLNLLLQIELCIVCNVEVKHGLLT
jgi:hypothetical protein